MRLTKEQIRNIAMEVVKQFEEQDVLDLSKNAFIQIEMEDGTKRQSRLNNDGITQIIIKLLYDDLIKEDKLNEEVREIMLQYRDEIDQENIRYGDLFKMIKKRLANERGIIL